MSRARRDGLVTIRTSRARVGASAAASDLAAASPAASRGGSLRPQYRRPVQLVERVADEHEFGHDRVPPCAPSSTGPETAADVEGRHPVAEPHGRVDQLDREGRSRPLAQPKVEVQQRPQAQPLEHDRVTRFDAPVGGDDPLRDPRHEVRCEERRRAGDEPVKDHGNTARDSAEDDADQRADLEPTDGGEDADRVRRVGCVAGDRLAR